MVPVGRGLHVLFAQSYLYCFLLNWCHSILHDYFGTTKWLDNGEAGLSVVEKPLSLSTSEDVSILHMLATQPFEAAELNFRAIMRILWAREDAAREHVHCLREDPAYFSAKVLEWQFNSDNRDVGTYADQRFQENGMPVVLGAVTRTGLAEAYLWKKLGDLLEDAQSAYANADAVANQGEFHSKIERDEPLTSQGVSRTASETGTRKQANVVHSINRENWLVTKQFQKPARPLYRQALRQQIKLSSRTTSRKYHLSPTHPKAPTRDLSRPPQQTPLLVRHQHKCTPA